MHCVAKFVVWPWSFPGRVIGVINEKCDWIIMWFDSYLSNAEVFCIQFQNIRKYSIADMLEFLLSLLKTEYIDFDFHSYFICSRRFRIMFNLTTRWWNGLKWMKFNKFFKAFLKFFVKFTKILNTRSIPETILFSIISWNRLIELFNMASAGAVFCCII